MYDSTIHMKSLARQLLQSDFGSNPAIAHPDNLHALLNEAVALGWQGFNTLDIRCSVVRGKETYQVTKLQQLLLLRHITANIKRITGVKQDDRAFIVQCIRTLLAEGVTYRVYKFDIQHFYESVAVPPILDRLRRDVAFSGQSVRLLESFFHILGGMGVTGLPRGLSLSATLAEYLMRDFDHQVINRPNVQYYARFVDDILIITNGREDRSEFEKNIRESLPHGLAFNHKSKTFDFQPFSASTAGKIEHSLDFLGYCFEVRGISKKDRIREVRVDIASSKVRRIKTRIARSLVHYQKHGNYKHLRDRVRLLTSNFQYHDLKRGTSRPSGIYYNYPVVDREASLSLKALDRFLRQALSSPHPCNKLRPTLLPVQKREILRLTFTQGHATKRFFHFNPGYLEELTSCWSYA